MRLDDSPLALLSLTHDLLLRYYTFQLTVNATDASILADLTYFPLPFACFLPSCRHVYYCNIIHKSLNRATSFRCNFVLPSFTNADAGTAISSILLQYQGGSAHPVTPFPLKVRESSVAWILQPVSIVPCYPSPC